MWVSLNKVVSLAVKRLNFEKENKRFTVFKIWTNLAQERYQNIKTTPLSFKEGVLIVGCKNSVIVNELQLRENNFLSEIKKKQPLIKKIRFICR